MSIVELESSLHHALKFRDEKLVDSPERVAVASGTTLVCKGTISSPGGVVVCKFNVDGLRTAR
jgi:hypothetical protein